MGDLMPDKWFNLAIVKEPLNWPIVWIMASVVFLAFHVFMTGWGKMGNGTQPAFSAPGQVAAETPTNLGSSAWGASLSAWNGDGVNVWTDGNEAHYPEDGYAGADF